MDSWDGVGDEYANTGQAANAQDFVSQLAERVLAVLAADGHAVCDMRGSATYDPASGCAVCGCGVFAPLGGSDEWTAAASADRAAQEAARQHAENAVAVPQRGGALAYEAQDPIRSTLALIDPTELYTPEDVERHILDTLYRLETGQLAERESVRKAYATKQAFDLKYNACITTSTGGAADVRKAMAMNDCAAEYAAMLEAEMVMKAFKATMHNLRSVITGYQSVAKSVAATYQAGGSQGGPPRQDRPPW